MLDSCERKVRAKLLLIVSIGIIVATAPDKYGESVVDYTISSRLNRRNPQGLPLPDQKGIS